MDKWIDERTLCSHAIEFHSLYTLIQLHVVHHLVDRFEVLSIGWIPIDSFIGSVRIARSLEAKGLVWDVGMNPTTILITTKENLIPSDAYICIELAHSVTTLRHFPLTFKYNSPSGPGLNVTSICFSVPGTNSGP